MTEKLPSLFVREPQFVEKVCIYKNRANSLSLSPNPFPMGRGYITGATAPSPCRGLRPCDPIFKKYRFIDSLIYLIQRPCLFSVPATFTQNIISDAGGVRQKPAYRDRYPYSHNSECGYGRQNIRKKHSCSE